MKLIHAALMDTTGIVKIYMVRHKILLNFLLLFVLCRLILTIHSSSLFYHHQLMQIVDDVISIFIFHFLHSSFP